MLHNLVNYLLAWFCYGQDYFYQMTKCARVKVFKQKMCHMIVVILSSPTEGLVI